MNGISKFTNSIKGMVLGVVLFMGSFVLIYWNEGRIDYSDLANKAVEIDALEQNVDEKINGQLVSTTGTVSSDNKISDDLYLVSQNYLALKRQIEVYAWVEEKIEKDSNENVSFNYGTEKFEDAEYFYKYSLQWVADPANSNSFAFPLQHQNPVKKINDLDKKVDYFKVGNYKIDGQNVTLPNYTPLALSGSNIQLSDNTILASDKYLFQGNGNINNPLLGDIRISYTAVNSGNVGTIFGQLKNNEIVNYTDKNNVSLYRLFDGTRESAIKTLHQEYVIALWGFRAIGFIVMWLGLVLILAPLSTVFHLLPVIGNTLSSASSTIIKIFTLVVALILSIIAILISILIHNIVTVFIIAGGVVLIIITFLVLNKKNNQTIKS